MENGKSKETYTASHVPLEEQSEELAKEVTKEQIKTELIESNPVMRALRENQKRLGLNEDEVPEFKNLDQQVRTDVQKVGEDYLREIEESTITEPDVAPVVELDPSVAVGINGPSKHFKDANGQGKGAPKTKGESLMMGGFDKIREGIREKQEVLHSIAKTAETSAQISQERQAEIGEKYLSDIEAATQEYHTVLDNVKKISNQMSLSKIDINRAWNSRTTSQKVITGIAAFLSGFGNGNKVLDMINHEMTLDVQAQKSDFERRGSAAKNLFSVASTVFGNGKDLSAIVQTIQLNNLKNMITSRAAGSMTQKAKLKAKEAIGKIDVKQGQLMQEIALARYKATQTARKGNKLGGEVKNKLNHYSAARNAVSSMAKALRAGDNTFTLWGENEFTLAEKELTTSITYALSGANIAEKELEMIMGLIPNWKMDSKTQKLALTRMMARIKRAENIYLAESPEEYKKITGKSSRKLDFKKD